MKLTSKNSNRRALRRSLSLATVLCLAAAALAASINFTPIDVPGATNTQATAITTGEIVGRYLSSDGAQHGFILRAGGFSTVDVPGADSTDAAWVNSRGDIVGTYDTSGRGHAYVLSGGVFTTIDFPSATPINTTGFGISDAGDVTGVEFNDNDFFHGGGYIFTHGSFIRVNFPHAAGTFPTMLLGPTLVVGAYMDTNGVIHGFQLSRGMFKTIDFPGSTFTWITGTNIDGDIVGFYNSADGNQHGFILSEGSFVSIDIPGATSTESNGIDAQGNVVGRYITPDGKTHGYLFRCADCSPN